MSFWTESRRGAFREVLKETCNILRISADDIEDYVRRHAHRYNIDASITKRTVERFLGGQHKTRPVSLDAMLVSLADDIERWENLPEADQAKLKELFTLKANWDASRAESPKPIPANPAPNTSGNQIAKVTDIMLAYLHLSANASRACEPLFFRASDPKKCTSALTDTPVKSRWFRSHLPLFIGPVRLSLS